MAKVALTTTVETVQEVKLSPKARQMALARVEEHAKVAKQIADLEARKDRLKAELDEIFVKEKQGQALLDGANLNGYSIVMVCGSSSKLDTHALMLEHGLGQADLDACTVTTPKKPYLKITAPKKEK